MIDLTHDPRDERILDLLENMAGAPSLTIGGTRYVLADELLLVWHRKGKGARWTWHPGDTYRLDRVPDYMLLSRDLRAWLDLARIDFVAHFRAMEARTL